MKIPCLLTILVVGASSLAQPDGITFDARVFYVTCPVDLGSPQQVDINGDGIAEGSVTTYQGALANEKATPDSGLALNKNGDRLYWDSPDRSLPQGVVCIAKSDRVTNGSTISIIEPDPLQYLVERADGRYDLHACETGTTITLRYWANNTSVMRITSTLAHDRGPLPGVALNVGAPNNGTRHSFHVNTPPGKWREYLVFDPKTAGSARIIAFVRMHGTAEALAAADKSPDMEQYSVEFRFMQLPRRSSVKLVDAINADPAFTVLAGQAQRITGLSTSKKEPSTDDLATMDQFIKTTKGVVLLSAPRVTTYSERTARLLNNQETNPTNGGKYNYFSNLFRASDSILGGFINEPRPGMAIIADVVSQSSGDGTGHSEWTGIACGVSLNPGSDKTTVNADFAIALRTMVGINEVAEQGLRAKLPLRLGTPEWFITTNGPSGEPTLIKVIVDAVAYDGGARFYETAGNG